MPHHALGVDAIISHILEIEGAKYTNHAADRGGPTKYGITLATLREARRNLHLTAEHVQQLTESEARSIYYDLYVVKPGFVHVLALLPEVGVECVDSGVNCGTSRAAKWLQESLNAFNRSYKNPPDWPELVVDGKIGIKTIDAISTFAGLRGRERASRVLKRAMDCMQGAHYLALGARSEDQETFMLGWFDNRIG